MQAEIYEYYSKYGRSFPWRETHDPYKIFLSEVMLQQTQTDRVVPKYEAFIEKFPDFESLARASFTDVLALWKGLGYNRRARYLQQSAQKVVSEFDGTLPQDPKVLKEFPGIGAYTSCSIPTFAYNVPTVFIETNVRAVFIHFFFTDRDDVHDKEIFPLIEETLDHDNPREWYYALMDFGSMLKKTQKNPSRKSVHHVKQAPFKNSNRQIRGLILEKLLEADSLDESALTKIIHFPSERIHKNLNDLVTEGLVSKTASRYSIAS